MIKLFIKIKIFAALVIVGTLIIGCGNDEHDSLHPFPTETFYSPTFDFFETFENDSVAFHLQNPVKCPISVQLKEGTLNPNLENLFEKITLRELQDTIIKVNYPSFNAAEVLKYQIGYGDVNKEIVKNEIDFPFPQDKTYEIIQGYHGSFSHHDIYSDYAIDFNLQIGDTITSADDGYVVSVIEGYRYHGTTEEWAQTDKSNFITVYHPESGLFTQYVHLDHNGALVELGDFVERGQPIGISGMTGFTNIPHLHFNVKIPNEDDGLISTSITFEGNIQGADLEDGDIVR